MQSSQEEHLTMQGSQEEKFTVQGSQEERDIMQGSQDEQEELDMASEYSSRQEEQTQERRRLECLYICPLIV